jgi:GT2 family glycosyltransferase
MNLAVIICVYKHEFIDELLAEIPTSVDLWVVDNSGDWEGQADYIIRPPKNLRWTRGTNRGIEAAYNASIADRNAYDAFVLMNDDVRLSPGFFDGLRAASDAAGEALVAPLYDDVYDHQKGPYRGPAANYQVPLTPGLERVPFVDFTCVLIPASVINSIGMLDEINFGEYGWGADYDYCLRAKALNIPIYTSHLSYLNHMHQGTAKTIDSDWSSLAGNEMELGMTNKYGPEWREKVWND